MTPSRYTHGHHESVLDSHRWRSAENSAAYLLGHLRAGDSLIDVGCGPATITADLARLMAPGRVLGVDRSAEVVERARNELDPPPSMELEVAEATELPVADATFDVAHAHQVLQHLEDPVGALREMARVVRPGGIVAARDGDYGAMAWYPDDPLLDRWRQLYREVARANGGEPDAGRRLLAWAQAAGFSEVRPSASAWCFATEQDRAWWGGLWATRITESDLAARAVELGLSDSDELRSLADAWRRWAETPDGWFCVPHGEVLIQVGQGAPTVRS